VQGRMRWRSRDRGVAVSVGPEMHRRRRRSPLVIAPVARYEIVIYGVDLFGAAPVKYKVPPGAR